MTYVKDVMAREIETATANAPLSEACRIMWENDCGSVPVVDPLSGRLCGIVTDRDACMASYLRHRPLTQIPIAVAMAADPVTCREDDDLAKVHETMASRQVRRLPVVGAEGDLLGVVSLNDIALAAARSKEPAHKLRVAETLSSISRQRRKPAPEKKIQTSEASAQV